MLLFSQGWVKFLVYPNIVLLLYLLGIFRWFMVCSKPLVRETFLFCRLQSFLLNVHHIINNGFWHWVMNYFGTQRFVEPFLVELHYILLLFWHPSSIMSFMMGIQWLGLVEHPIIWDPCNHLIIWTEFLCCPMSACFVYSDASSPNPYLVQCQQREKGAASFFFLLLAFYITA